MLAEVNKDTAKCILKPPGAELQTSDVLALFSVHSSQEGAAAGQNCINFYCCLYRTLVLSTQQALKFETAVILTIIQYCLAVDDWRWMIGDG